MCIPAPACKAARAEATRRWPMRNQASDGICGDARHQARVSDHNQGNAVDITHDPAHGVDCNRLAEIVKSDPRVKYVIWNRRIYNPSISKSWRPYNGSNPHTKHMHISILHSARNNTSPWFAPKGDDVTEADIEKIAQRVFEKISGDPMFGKRFTLNALAMWCAELAKKKG